MFCSKRPHWFQGNLGYLTSTPFVSVKNCQEFLSDLDSSGSQSSTISIILIQNKNIFIAFTITNNLIVIYNGKYHVCD